MQERDYYQWLQTQATALRSHEVEKIDWEGIAEALEDMGKSERRAFSSRLAILIMHLLKWDYQPNKRSRSWELTIQEQRYQLARLLEDNPSFRREISEFIAKAYPLAVIKAKKETGLENFPLSCPYDEKEILD